MKTLRSTLSALALLAVVSCGGEDGPAGPGPAPICLDCDITTKEAVLTRFESVFNKRNIAGYDNLLDDNFVFYLAPGDVVGGLPAQWGRAEEIDYMSKLLNKNFAGPYRCSHVEVDLLLNNGVQWVEIIPATADETWYQTTVFDEYLFNIGPDQLISKNGAKVQLTVRNAGTEEEPAWKLVEWRELESDDNLVASTSMATDTRTWGEIKSLYRP